MVGLPLLAATPVTAKPIEANENSVQVTVDSFVAYLKSETNQALTIAARMARDNKDSLAAAKSYLDSQISAWRDLLSDRKARPGTLGKDAFGRTHRRRGKHGARLPSRHGPLSSARLTTLLTGSQLGCAICRCHDQKS